MGYALRKPLKNEQHEKLITTLQKPRYQGRQPIKMGSTRNTKYYGVVWLDENDSNIIYGHLTSKKESIHGTFRAWRGDDGPMIQVTPEPGCVVSLDQLEGMALHALTHIFRKVTKKKKGRANIHTLNGFYLYRSKNRATNGGGRDLGLAIEAEEMSPLFGKQLLVLGIYVIEHNGSTKRLYSENLRPLEF
jgi:hypothetical protein